MIELGGLVKKRIFKIERDKRFNIWDLYEDGVWLCPGSSSKAEAFRRVADRLMELAEEEREAV